MPKSKYPFPEIAATLSTPISCKEIEKHVKAMYTRLSSIIPRGIFTNIDAKKNDKIYHKSFERFESLLPFVSWIAPKEIPGAFTIVLVCKGDHTEEKQQFFMDMVKRWLIPNRIVTFLSTLSLDFHFKRSPHKKFYIIEIVVQIEYKKDAVSMVEHLSDFVEQIRFGIKSRDFAQYLLESKGLSLKQKIHDVDKLLISIKKRRPIDFEDDVFHELRHFHLRIRDDFKEIRSVKHLCRLVCSFYLFRKKLNRDIVNAASRKILLKLLRSSLRFPFGKKRVLGLIITISKLKQNEVFREKHIIKAFCNLIPNVKAVPASFLSYSRDDSIRNVYIEVEKKNGSFFNLSEIKMLCHKLPDELISSTEQLVNALYIQHNEEEIYRNITILSQELRYVNDIPQVIVSFQKQDQNSLTFLVCLLRILKNDSKPFSYLFEHVKDVSFIPHDVKIVGHLRKKYPKEANIFQIEVPKEYFLRHDYAVDLYQARLHVVEQLQKILGIVRDYNGGWLVKLHETLRATKLLLAQIEGLGHREKLIENLFYSLNPPVMRTLLAPEQIKDLFVLFYDILDRNLDRDQYLLTHSYQNSCFYLMIKGFDSSYQEGVEKAIKTLHIDSTKLCSVSIEAYGSSYFGYLLRHPTRELAALLQSNVEGAMSKWSEKKKKNQFLRIPLGRPISLDPRIGMDRTSGIIIKMLYEGLMRMDQKGKPTFGVAEDVQISPDGKTYTFKLRNCLWTNGFPVIALDFEYAWKKIVEPGFRNLRFYLFYPIKNAKAIKNGTLPVESLGVKAVNSKTLVVELEHPAPYFLELVSHWAYSPLCHDIDIAHPGWSHGGEGYICNGPFKLTRWKDHRGLQVVKNQSYWDSDHVQLEGINILFIENSLTAFHMYEEGTIDWVGEPLIDLGRDVYTNMLKTGRLIQHSSPTICWYQFNVAKFPFTNRKMRQAFGFAIDRKQIIQESLTGFEKPAFSVIPPNIKLQSNPYFKDGDIEQARALFQEGLSELGITKEQLPPISLIYSSKGEQRAIAELVKNQWQEAFGISIVPEGVDWRVYQEHSIQRNFHIRSSVWYSWVEDPIYNLENYRFRDNAMNATLWEHPEYIKLLDLANNTTDPEKRKQYMHRAEKLLLFEMPVVPLYYGFFRYLKREHVQNVYISNIGQVDFKWASVGDLK